MSTGVHGLTWKKGRGKASIGLTWRQCVRYRELYIFLLPAIAAIFIFNYIPIYGITLAFKDFSPALGIIDSPWVGMKHFARFFSLPTFWPLIGNTVILSAMSIAINFPLPIILALLLNQIRRERIKRAAQTILYMPNFISTVVLVGMINVLLSPSGGIYGGAMNLLGLDAPNLLGKSTLFRWLYVLSDSWQHTGWNSIIYIAALSSVDPSLYEAATVDGANRLGKIVHIDLPALVPTMTILLILSTGSILGVGFEKIFLMQNSTNVTQSEVIATYVYKIGLISAQFSFGTAIGLFNTVVNFVMLFVVNKICQNNSETSLW